MKKINIMAAALVGLLAFASCDADRDDNPIMSVSRVIQSPQA